MNISAPTNVRLIQMEEGVVAVRCTLPDSHLELKVYLSDKSGELGSAIPLSGPTAKFDCLATFKTQPGTVKYATVRSFESRAVSESQNTDQIQLQMYQLVNSGHDISCFFHEENTERVWAVGVENHSDAKSRHLSILYSDDYFETFHEFKSWVLNNVNIPAKYASFYIDTHGNKYLSVRPTPWLCRKGASEWLPAWSAESCGFSNPESAILVPGWNISEGNGLIVFSEYGTYQSEELASPRWPHHRIIQSSDPKREEWRVREFAGKYKHIHTYQINPYDSSVHILSIGDFLSRDDNTAAGDYLPGLYISIDGGATFGKNLLDDAEGAPPGDHFNGPCMVTFLNDGSAFVTNDTWGIYGYWWVIGPNKWDRIRRSVSLVNDVFPEYKELPGGKGYPVVPWSAMAISESGEAYGSTSSNNHPAENSVRLHLPMPICRFDYTGDTVTSSVIALSWDYEKPPQYTSFSRGNRIPSQAKFVFNSGFGGLRIPRVV